MATNMFSQFGLNIDMLSIGTVFMWMGIAFVILLFIGIGVFMFFQNKKYIYTIKLWRKINGKWYETHSTKAKEVPVSLEGARLFFCKNPKKYLARPEKEAKKNEYWYYIRADGEWINFVLGDIDTQTGIARADFVDRDMRLSRTATEQILKLRLQEKSFWDKFGMWIIMGIFMIIVTVCLVVLFTQLGKVAQSLDTAVLTAGKVLTQADTILQRMTSGAIPVK